MFRHLCYLTICLLSVAFTACQQNIETIHYDNSPDHTLLIYMAGDNSLSSYVKSNLYSIGKGMLASEIPLNVVIFRDNKTNKENLPVLYQLRRRENEEQLDTVYLKRWKEDVNSADPEVMAEAISLTFNRFDTEVKGVEIWSHGLSWIPGSSYTPTALSAQTRAMEYVGVDEQQFGEIWDIRKAILQTGIHLDYMLFDACHMSTAEVAYEFRDLCDYMMASPTEIMGDGFPYKEMIQSLSQIQDKEQLEIGLTAAYDDFATLYAQNGSFCLLRTQGLEQLYQACLQLHQATADIRQQWRETPMPNQKKIQYFGRESTYSRYFFYDLLNWAAVLDPEDNHGYHNVKQALNQCVIKHYASQWFHASTSIYIAQCCGLALSIPEFWPLSGNKKLDVAYSQLEWQLRE